MSSLVHLARPAAARAELAADRERGAVTGDVLEPTRRLPATAQDVMTRFPETVHASDSMWKAWDRLERSPDGHLVVLDDHRRPLGVLDQRLLAVEWPPGPVGSRRTPVHTLLRGRARPRVTANDTLPVVAATMLGARAGAVPVVDRAGRLYGLVTLWHLAEAVAQNLAQDLAQKPGRDGAKNLPEVAAEHEGGR
jgi:CBS domain-containing protein